MTEDKKNMSRYYEYTPLSSGATAYQAGYTAGYPEREGENGYKEYQERVRRTRQRPQNPQAAGSEGDVASAGNSGQAISVQELRQLIGIAVLIGVLLIGLLVINAYAASIQCSINDITKANLLIEDEIDTLNMKIDSSTSIEQIESYAMKKLNMNYPKSNQCIYITEDTVLMEDFSAVLRRKAYE